MTGTSVDGLDLAIIDIEHPVGPTQLFDDEITVVAAKTIALPQSLRASLLACGQPEQSSVELFGRCDSALGKFIGGSVCHWLAELNIDHASVTAIGSHGQTVRHRPPGSGEHPFTLQIGDPNQIAEMTGIETIADFRRRDMAALGQGAPLAPGFHRVLFADQSARTCVLNIGGISNISPLNDSHLGFDSGPGNCLMDEWFAQHHSESSADFDAAGAWAASGKVNPDLLDHFLDDEYFSAAPPKSTGREHFNSAWLASRLERMPARIPANDVQATLATLTAVTIMRAITKCMPDVAQIPVCGGGRQNANLMACLTKALSDVGGPPCRIERAEEWGIDGDSVEAAAFAWLAFRRHYDLPGNLPAATGARGNRVLGAIYPG